MNLFNVVLFLCVFFISQVSGYPKYGYAQDDDEYIGNPDHDAIIDRPCQIYDIYCIRKFFTNHAACTVAKGPLPDPVYRTQTNYYVPRTNFTAQFNEVIVTGLNKTSIEEFYINKKTNKLVMEIHYRNLELDVPTAFARFYRRGREPIVTFSTFTGVRMNDFTVTVIIPNADDLELDKAEMTVFFNERTPGFFFSPTTFNPPDPQVIWSLTSLFTNIPAIATEVAQTEVYYYASIYIQSNICDFGLMIL